MGHQGHSRCEGRPGCLAADRAGGEGGRAGVQTGVRRQRADDQRAPWSVVGAESDPGKNGDRFAGVQAGAARASGCATRCRQGAKPDRQRCQGAEWCLRWAWGPGGRCGGCRIPEGLGGQGRRAGNDHQEAVQHPRPAGCGRCAWLCPRDSRHVGPVVQGSGQQLRQLHRSGNGCRCAPEAAERPVRGGGQVWPGAGPLQR